MQHNDSEFYRGILSRLDKSSGSRKSEAQSEREAIGKKIREYRVQCGLSQQKLANTLGVTRMQVMRWETGRNKPSPEILAALMQAGVVFDRGAGDRTEQV